LYSFEIVDIDKVNICEFNSFSNKTPFTTIQWIQFLSEDKNAIPIIIRITNKNELIGYFSGLIFKILGFKIFGSPFKGWNTNYMGFDLYNYDIIDELIEPTIQFVMRKTKCIYLEMVDRNITPDKIKNLKYEVEVVKNLEIDIDKNDELLIKSIKKDCREFIRQFERRGAYIEVTEPTDEFIKVLYSQLCEVFKRQNLIPPYRIDKIQKCVKYLKDTGMMLCLQVKEPLGSVIASYIFLGLNQRCIAWCTSSCRKYQHFRPNEYLIWYGIRKFRDLGYKIFDFTGIRQYKYKWNPKEVHYIRITATKYVILKYLRDAILKLYWVYLKVKAFILYGSKTSSDNNQGL